MLEDVLLVKKLLAFLAYVMGYAAIPILAKTFSGALGNLIGMANDRSKGLIDKTRNSLQQRSQNRRDNRRRGRRARLQDRAGEEKPLKSLNPLKADNWKEGWKNRNRARVGIGAGFKRWNAGAKPEFRKQLLEQPGPKTPEEKAAADKERERLRKEDPGNVWQKYRRRREDIREGRYPNTALGRYQRGQRQVSDVAAQSVTEAMVKEQKEAAERAEHAIYGQDFGGLLETVKDGNQLRVIRQAAANQLGKKAAAEQVQELFDAAVVEQKTMGHKAPLVEIIKNMKDSNAFFEGGLDKKLPHLAKGGGWETQDGKFMIKEVPDFKFMREAGANDATAWPPSLWDNLVKKVESYPTDKNTKVTVTQGYGKDKKEVEMPLDEYIFSTQGRAILESQRARNDAGPEVVKRIREFLHEHNLDETEDKPSGDWRQDGGYL